MRHRTLLREKYERLIRSKNTQSRWWTFRINWTKFTPIVRVKMVMYSIFLQHLICGLHTVLLPHKALHAILSWRLFLCVLFLQISLLNFPPHFGEERYLTKISPRNIVFTNSHRVPFYISNTETSFKTSLLSGVIWEFLISWKFSTNFPTVRTGPTTLK